MTPHIKTICVIGAGTMGHGIAQVSALAGYNVFLCDVNHDVLSRASAQIMKNLNGGVTRKKLTEKERDTALTRITTTAELDMALASSELCIEAVVENMAIKREVFETMELHTPSNAIFASNTSSLPIGKIAANLDNPARVIGLHFFNPVHIMSLVEVVLQDITPGDVRDAALLFVDRIGKTPVLVNDSPGFATSRLGVVLALEAIRMVEQGVASAADIDRALELGYKHPMGPLRTTDIVGLDVRLAIAETLHSELGGDHYAPPKLLRDKVAAGELGRKSGRGFYEWNE
jgi:3-hydroxybutyryl-CoA dehydrogenase